MKAKITEGKLKGIEFEVSEETVENIKREIPKKEVNVWFFLAKKSSESKNDFILALEEPDKGSTGRVYNLPNNYEGRGGFSKEDVREIIKGLQELIGDK